MIVMDRQWAMASPDTFTVRPIREFVEEELATLPDGAVVADPFARNARYGTVTNDLNPEFDCDHHMDALEFLRTFDDGSVDCVIYDPPYSSRQVSECYKRYGYEVTAEATRGTWKRRHMDEVARILRPGGLLLAFGWHSNYCGKKRGFDIRRIRVVAHGGGSAHDTLCVAEVKRAS